MFRRHFSQIAVSALLLASAPFAAHAAADINQPAPLFTAQTADGKAVDLAAYKGKVVVLEWTNDGCPFVAKHYDSGNIPKLQKEAAAKGVVWLQVVSSAPGEQGFVDASTAAKLNASRKAAPAATVVDPQGKVGKLYGAQTTPHIFIIDAQGQLVYKGGIDSIASTKQQDIEKAEPYVANAIKAVTSGQRVATPSTKPYGCSVKYAS